MRRLQACAAAVAALALSALSPPAAAQPMSLDGPPQVDAATALAEAARLVAKTPLPQEFRLAAWPLGPKVTHPASGLTCTFLSEAQGNEVTVYIQHGGAARDVGCRMPTPGMVQSLFASHIGHMQNAEFAFEGAVQAMRAREPALAPLTEPIAAPDGVRLARFATGDSPRALYERVAVFRKGDWIIKQRLTAPRFAMAAADRLADLMLAENLRSGLTPPPGVTPQADVSR